MSPQLFTFGSFAFDCERGTLLRRGSPVPIGTKGLALLKALLEANGEVVTKSALMDSAWPSTNIEESNLTVQIAALRKVLGRSADGEEWIATIPRVGYRLIHSTPLRNRGFDTAVDAAVPQATGSTPSIAVLPFTNMSSDPEQEYFGDGLAEDLITDLSKVAGLLVIARHSSFAYKGKQADIRSIATDLSVRYVIEGSVRRAADRVRISAQIIDALDNRPVWAERFDRNLADIFALQDEIVARIVSALADLLPPEPSIASQRPASVEAYDLFVRGRALVNRLAKGNQPARLLIEKSIKLDPGFADAHAWLAMIHLSERVLLGEPAEPHLSLALATARRAVSLDPKNPGAHAILGDVLINEGRVEAGTAELARALEINPNHADAWVFLGEVSAYQGDAAAGINHIRKAFRLNPFPPGWYHWYLGFVEYAAGLYEDAVQTLRHESTHRLASQRILAASLAQLGRLEEARTEADQFLATYPRFTVQNWADTQPFQHEADLRHFIDGYIKAGLPR